MSQFALFCISLALAADAFAVAISNGISLKRFSFKAALKTAVFFGFFQMMMTVLGWLAGSNFKALIEGTDHWLAFGLLSLVGGRMIIEGTKGKESVCRSNCFATPTLALLAVATSIDALAVGLSLAFIEQPIVSAAVMIGAVALALSFVGVYLGKHFGSSNQKSAEIIGGLILCAIGIKILIEHLG